MKRTQCSTTFVCIVFANLDFNHVKTLVEVVDGATAILLSFIYLLGILAILFDP